LALIVANIVSLKLVLISALCMSNNCQNGEAVQSVGQTMCLFINQSKMLREMMG